MNTSILPRSDDTYDLGSADYRWRNLWVSNKINNVAIGLRTGGLLAFWYDLRAKPEDFSAGRLIEITVHNAVDFVDYNPQGITDFYGVRIMGYIKPEYSETYTFYITSDDGVRVWFNGKLVVNGWKQQGGTTYSWTESLTANRWYPIVIEHYEHSGGEKLLLEWESTSQSRETISGDSLAWSFIDLLQGMRTQWGDFHIIGGGIYLTDAPEVPSSPPSFDVGLFRDDSAVLGIMGTLKPKSDDTYSLGSSSNRWKDGYFSGTVYASTFSGNIDWSNITNKPSTYPPEAHTHSPSDISPQGDGSGLDADTVDGEDASAFTHAKNGGKNIWVQSSEPTAEATGDIWIQTE